VNRIVAKASGVEEARLHTILRLGGNH
jgi:hypothetical protein